MKLRSPLRSRLRSQIAKMLAFFLVPLVLFACTPLATEPEETTTEAAKPVTTKPVTNDIPSSSLPVQYQKPSYMVDSPGKDELDSQANDVVLKVGARISSKKKLTLRDIMKLLASQKRLNISWASDVNQDALVDVDIKADDDFYKAIDNILRQVDYFYELQGSTIVIKYRETKQFHVAMPFTKQAFSTGTGGNVLGGDVGGEGIAKNVEGTIKLVSEKNEFDIWSNIQLNIEQILNTSQLETYAQKLNKTDNTPSVPINNKEPEYESKTVTKGHDGKLKESTYKSGPPGSTDTAKQEAAPVVPPLGTFMIDKPVGLVTVTAPRPILDKVEAYFKSLQKEIYKQISIEAKIIEVQLIDSSSIGINWDSVLKNFQISGSVEFGDGGSIFSWDPATNQTTTPRLISNISINGRNFEAFLNALKTQGNTKILSNPKISVLNGQPAMITVGQNITYIDSIEVDVDTETGLRTYTAETANILSGVGLALTATVLDNSEIIMNLVPVTSELQGEIEYRQVGEGEVGLPVVNVREMSTTVRVKNGDMLVIGGLISDVNDNTGSFAPVMGDIPLVKYLFGYEEKIKNKRELIILLKPRII